VADPAELVAPSAVFVTRWRSLDKHELEFLRSIDMSALRLAEFPRGAGNWSTRGLEGCSSLESAILPIGLRVLPVFFFRSCWRLSHVGTSRCTALERIEQSSCCNCRSLVKFDFPRTILAVGILAFQGTAMEEIDLSETVAISATFSDMIFLERLTLPRHCVLEWLAGLPALRMLTFGRAAIGQDFRLGSHVQEVRFEGFLAPKGTASGLENARVHAEVNAVFRRESSPSCPP
jgi:hypothetical protein